jgi:hypothetical protein
LVVILVVVVVGAILLIRNLNQKKQKSAISQPVAEEVQKPAAKESKKETSLKKSKTSSSLPEISSAKPAIIKEIIREKVTIEIPEDIKYTKTCNQNRCEILIYY